MELYILCTLQCHPSRRTETYILTSSATISNAVDESMQHKHKLFKIFVYFTSIYTVWWRLRAMVTIALLLHRLLRISLYSRSAIAPGHLHSDAASGKSESQANCRIQRIRVIAIQTKTKPQLAKKHYYRKTIRCVNNNYWLIQRTSHSTHILFLQGGFGTDQKLCYWKMTILASQQERSSSLKRSALLMRNAAVLAKYLPNEAFNRIVFAHNKLGFTIATQVHAGYLPR